VPDSKAENTATTNGTLEYDAKLAFRCEQVKLLFGQLNLIYLADAIAGGFLFLLLITSSNTYAGYIWYGTLLASTGIRTVLAKRQKLELLSESSLKRNWFFLVSGAFGPA
jgi:hypothetical protein